MVQESIFNLISQHDSFAHGRGRGGKSMMPEHTSTYNPDTGLDSAFTAPPSSDEIYSDEAPHQHYRAPPTAQRGSAPQQARQQPARVASGARGAPGHFANAPPELDAAEVARKRQNAEMRGGAMAAALAPELTYQMKMQQSLSVKNHAKDHKTRIKEQSIINGLVKAQGEQPQTRPAARKPEFAGSKSAAGGKLDYVEKNRTLKQTLDHAAKAPTSTNAKAAPIKYKEAERPRGQIPKYLVERKIELQVDKMMKEEEERKKHAGPEAMPEEERVATLRELEKQRDAALKEMNQIPPSKHQLHANQVLLRGLESKLKEIENAIVLFSRKVVYIK
uniref:Enkurin domain-containing protein n=1 Tax=Hemiselmis tepida TaxID=464990 RepID=A0A7S0W1Z3_9CRYP|mmetsp:Transcript_371/g.988  ORF Transcript_371/g.988 Transcript_371/m.988 type:complete len:333 (+) Transcript_371:211-1209(+)